MTKLVKMLVAGAVTVGAFALALMGDKERDADCVEVESVEVEDAEIEDGDIA